jgi:DNA-binding transcriptional LysR family regulator
MERRNNTKVGKGKKAGAASTSAEQADVTVPRYPIDGMHISALRIYAAVIESHSFQKAAKQLGLAPSTVSKHIDALENRLGSLLIMRTTRHLSVTNAGFTFHEYCKKVLENLDEASAQLSGAHVGLEGKLRVVAPPSFSSSILSRCLPDFMLRHPRLEVEVLVRSDYVDLVKEGVDIAIALDDEHQNKLPTIFVGANRVRICASTDYLKRYGVPKVPQDIWNHRCLSGIGSQYDDRWPFKIGSNVRRINVNRVLTTNNGDLLKSCCLSGQGLAALYAFHADMEIATGALVEVLAEYNAGISALYARVPNRRFISPHGRAFLDFLQAYLPK